MVSLEDATDRQSGNQSMDALLEKSGIPEVIWSEIQIFKPEEFGALSQADLQSFIDGLVFPSEPSDILIKARLRLLWKRCNSNESEHGAAVLHSSAMEPLKPLSLSEPSTWTDAFPKKLSSAAVRTMMKRFSEKYPSEPLGSDVTPSPRLLSLVHAQIQEHRWRWIPWKLRLSEDQHESKSMERSLKAPRLESVLWEEIPSRDLPAQNMGKAQMMESLHLQAVANALAEGAHLYTLRELNRRFITKCFEQYPKETNLRPPNRIEAELAEQKLWQQIASLYNDEEWSLDESIREIAIARNEVQVLLMPRAVPAKSQFQDRQRKGNGKGKLGNAGKGDKGSLKGSEGKGAHGQTFQVQGHRVGTSWQSGKTRRLLCQDFQLGKCTRSNCRFEHVCGVIMPGGRMCLGDHAPADHKRTPH
ncbi:unnamed protein product [Symbiodinium sp. CCMP2592]|nr:unnamed protein product [Symbiodinium sp. CCMP2592]